MEMARVSIAIAKISGDKGQPCLVPFSYMYWFGIVFLKPNVGFRIGIKSSHQAHKPVAKTPTLEDHKDVRPRDRIKGLLKV